MKRSVYEQGRKNLQTAASLQQRRQRSNALTLLPRINVDPPVQSKWRRIFFFQVAFRFEKGLGDLFGGERQRDLRMGSEHVIPIVLTGAEASDAGGESHHLPGEVLPSVVGIEAAVR